MTGDRSATRPPDPVERDDRLLAAIGRGEPLPEDHPTDDPLTALLIGWHAELLARSQQLESALPLPSPKSPPQEAPEPSTTLSAPDSTTAGRLRPPGRPARVPGATRRSSRRVRQKAHIGATLALVTLTGGVWFSAARAQPGELMWPVTRLVHAQRAETLITEREIGGMLARARQDLATGRHTEARHHLDRAAALLSGIRDDATLIRLHQDIEQLRNLLPSLPPGAPEGRTPADPHVPTGTPASSAATTARSASEQATRSGTAPPRSAQATPSAAGGRQAAPTRPTPPSRPTRPTTAPRPPAPMATRHRHRHRHHMAAR